VECDQRLLLHQAPHLKEMFDATDTCPYTKRVIMLPDFKVELVGIALSLLEEAAGKEVMLDYEGLLPAGPVLTVLNVAFKIDIKVLVQHCSNIQKPLPGPGTRGGGGEVCPG
jgi:hypothetical protein